jgi:signal transduction histidine kinase
LNLEPGSGEWLEFRYAAASLLAADRIRFRHRLDGYDHSWSSDTDLRLAFYTNLRPGKYLFRVKASNSRGIWSDDETSLALVILPFFWQTKIFYISAALVLLALAGVAHWQRIRVLGRFQELKHREELAVERTRIAADMHDDLGATLTKIAVLGEVTKAQLATDSTARASLDNMAQSARQVTSRIRDLVWATNPRNDTLENLAAYLREQVSEQLEGTTLHSQLEFAPILPDCRVSATFRRNLLLVAKEALANAMKHSAATKIRVSFEAELGCLVVVIKDDGRGFDPAEDDARGNGLANMRRRTTDLGGEIQVCSSPGEGTSLKFVVPLPHELR